MKSLLFSTIFSLTLLTSCFSVKSNGSQNVGAVYKKPLFVITDIKDNTKGFSKKLKRELDEELANLYTPSQIILVERNEIGRTKDTIKLDSKENINSQINTAVLNLHSDVIIIFNPTHVQWANGAISSIKYDIIAIDVISKKQIWKGNFKAGGLIGPKSYAEQAAKESYQKLKEDRIL